MPKDHSLIDDISRLAGSAAGSILEMRHEAQQLVAAKFDEYAARMQLVTREEFEVLQELVHQLRRENEELKQRLDGKQ